MLDFSVTFIITIINIAVLFFILRLILFKPVTKFMADRAKRVQDSFDQANKEKANAQEFLAQSREKLQEANSEADNILDCARKSAEEAAELTINDGINQAVAVLEKARRQMDKDRQSAFLQFGLEAAALVADASAHLVHRELSGDDQILYRHLLLDELGEHRIQIKKYIDAGAGELTCTLDTAVPLDPAAEEEIVRLIAGRTGANKVTMETRLAPEILGGYRLCLGGLFIDASLKQQAAALKTDLEKDIIDSASGKEYNVAEYSDFTRVLQEKIALWESRAVSGSCGHVVQVGDSVAMVYGLDGVIYGEQVEFESGATGLVLNLEEKLVGCMLLSGSLSVKDGDEVKGTGKVVSVPAGSSFLGRVLNPLGEPIDGKGLAIAEAWLPVESPAAPVIDRGSVDTPLHTGIVSIDAMIPIGRGQRELIIGDRQTGKTAIAIDTIINQKGKNVICVYCAIGQKASSVAAIVSNLEKHGAMEYTFIVLASASDSAALQYMAPYSAVAMAEHFMHQGSDVLVIYDDLSKHAVAYRAISLLLRRPPGREAFPGDVFYLHSRLLERAAKLTDAKGGGSITALPIVETQAGDISSYIPTNVISITDGQIFLDSGLFNSGFRPAIDVGLSVSRVGGTAQSAAIRKISGRLRLDLAQYREMAAFAQFGSDLDKATRDKLAQGERLMEVLKQSQYSPYSMEQQTAILFLAINGYLVEVQTKNIGTFISNFLVYLNNNHSGMMREIKETGVLSPDQESAMRAAAESFLRKLDV